MTEAEWLTSEDPQAMLTYLTRDRAYTIGQGGTATMTTAVSDRKLRLFGLACALTVPWTVRGEALERIAQEQPAADWVARWCHPNASDARLSQATKATLLREIVGDPFRPVVLPPGPPVKCKRCEGDGWAATPDGLYASRAACKACEGKGTLWNQPCPWLTPTVLSLATAAYEERHSETGRLDNARLAVLSDALEEAGATGEPCGMGYGKGHHSSRAWMSQGPYWYCERCGGTEWVPHPILAHLRSPGPHVRGCHVLDAILGHQ